jgi:hypothetical protein
MTTPAVDERFRLGGPGVVHETVDDETIIVNLETGTYYDLNPSGARVFRGVVEGATVDDVIAAVADQYGVDPRVIAPDVAALIDQLRDEGLIAPVVAGDPVPMAVEGIGDSAGEPYSAPVLGRYTDMQQLLLLDPIHEVDETGWPRRA